MKIIGPDLFCKYTIFLTNFIVYFIFTLKWLFKVLINQENLVKPSNNTKSYNIKCIFGRNREIYNTYFHYEIIHKNI